MTWKTWMALAGATMLAHAVGCLGGTMQQADGDEGPAAGDRAPGPGRRGAAGEGGDGEPPSEPAGDGTPGQRGEPGDDRTDPPIPWVDSGPIPYSAAWGPPNVSCPELPPYTEVGSPHGECCYRNAPNSLRIKALSDNPLSVTEYRLNYDVVVNHPDSVGLPALLNLAVSRSDNHEWNMLWRFEHPRMMGKPVSGPGYFSFGWGVYNCNGDHSYYGPLAAPTNKVGFPGATRADRWAAVRVPVEIDATRDDVGRMRVAFEDRPRTDLYTPFLNADTFELEWELIARDLTLLSMDFSERALDCVGARVGSAWEPGGVYRTYVTVTDNHYPDNGIPVLGFQTMSQLLAFGLLGEEKRQALDPLDGAARCMPQLDLQAQDRTCPWLKLPDSLCPVDDAERALFGCHMAWEGNVDGQPVNCTATAPTTPRDAAAPDEGQCCDPLGYNGLPMCNAWAMDSDFVAASADITDWTASALATRCH